MIQLLLFVCAAVPDEPNRQPGPYSADGDAERASQLECDSPVSSTVALDGMSNDEEGEVEESAEDEEWWEEDDEDLAFYYYYDDGNGKIPDDGPRPACPSPAVESVDDLHVLAMHGVEAIYGKHDARFWPENENGEFIEDTEEEYAAHGGSESTHVYGEAKFDGMFKILSEAVKLSTGVAQPNASDFAEFAFYDLGSGYGKFPSYASFLGFRRSVGVELDSKMAAYTKDREAACRQQFPCMDGRLEFQPGSFFDHTEWKKGTGKRVIWINSLCMGEIWPQMTEHMRTAEWGEGTVVAATNPEIDEIPREFHPVLSGLRKGPQIFVNMTWDVDVPVQLYYRARPEKQRLHADSRADL
jgi:hypothetical protein